jgi:phospholipid/cholesterol/gamma-HCH transport system ATP-binding protein
LTGGTILKLIDDCHRRLGFTGIIVTHEIPRIFTIVDRVALLHDGRIQFEGTPDEIRVSRNPLVNEFLEGNMYEKV